MTKKSQQPPTGSITVTVDFDRYLDGTMRDAIVNQIVVALSDKLEDGVTKLVQQRIEALAREQFDALARAKVQEFFTMAHRKTNTWGEPTGEAVSLREILLDKFRAYLDENVDEKGQVSSYSKSMKRSQWMLNELAHKPLHDAVDQTVQSIAAKAKEQIQASVSRYIAEQLSPRIEVPQLKAQ
jgi:hypothetical protein